MNALDAAFHFHETALKVGAQRQQVIASNMANADTPGFRAGNVDFAAALARATGESGVTRTGLHGTHAGHVDRSADREAVVLSTTDLTPRAATQPSVDANTVDLDAERAAFADNTVRYETSYAFLNHQIKTLMTAVSS